MSDGNFNRNLLPYKNYQSGLRAGRAQMRTLALEAFSQWLTQHMPAQREEALSELHDRLS